MISDKAVDQQGYDMTDDRTDRDTETQSKRKRYESEIQVKRHELEISSERKPFEAFYGSECLCQEKTENISDQYEQQIKPETVMFGTCHSRIFLSEYINPRPFPNLPESF
jgi:hypothetical protein